MDQLDPTKVELSTVSLGPILFGNSLLIPPDGLSNYTTFVDLRPASNLIVQIRAGLDPISGLLSWSYTSLDPETGLLPEDPLAGLLPPNLVPPQGEGSVMFIVKAKVGLPTGTQITNAASIIFDSNKSIITPTWLTRLTTVSQVAASLHCRQLNVTRT